MSRGMTTLKAFLPCDLMAAKNLPRHALVIVHGITVMRFGVKPLGRLKGIP